MDIDIDTPTTFEPTSLFKEAVVASMVRNGELVKHPCGHYFQNISVDPETNLAAIPYEEAENLGYFKIDFLHLSILDFVESKQQLRALIHKEPKWDLLCDKNVVSKLFQLHRHYNIISKIKPRSVNELADVIALIRPNKRHLLTDYLQDRVKVSPLLYRQKDDDKSSFKRSHAIAYALTVVLQLHLIEQNLL